MTYRQSLALVAMLTCVLLVPSGPVAAQGSLRSSPASELDFLSRTTNDEFPDISKQSDRQPVSVTVRGLNKVTAKYQDITIPMNETANFGRLEILAHCCDKRPPEEFPEVSAFLQIFDKGSVDVSDVLKVPTIIDSEPSEKLTIKVVNVEAGANPGPAVAGVPENSGPSNGSEGELRLETTQKIFSGWMFASSPALNALEHPVYDVWVIDCQT